MPTAETELEYRTLFECGPGLYLVLAPNLTIVTASDAYLKATMVGRDIAGRHVFEVFPDNPDDAGATGTRHLRASLERVLSSRLADTMPVQKYDIRGPDGRFEERYWSPVNVPILNRDGEVRYILHRVEDVTKTRATAEELAETNRFLETVLDNIPHMVFVKEVDQLRFIRFNRAGEELLGTTRTALLGKNDYDLFPREQAEQFQARDRDAVREGGVLDIAQESIMTPRGMRALHTKTVVIRDSAGSARFLLGISEDITESREDKEALLRLSAIIDDSDDAVIGRTLDGKVTSWNRGAERMFGYTAADMIGGTLATIFPSDRFDEELELVTRIRRNERVEHFETVRRHRDGHAIHISVSLSPLRDGAGQIVGVSMIARDVSERRAAQAALIQKNHELEVAARIDRIGARVMLAFNQQDDASKPAAEVLRVLSEEAGYRPLAFYEADEWQGGMVFSAGSSLPPGFDHRVIKSGEGFVGEAGARRETVFIDSPGDSMFSLDTGVGLMHAATLFAVPLIHRGTVLGVISGASPTALSSRERAWLSHVGSQVAIGLHARRQFEELKVLSSRLNERTREVELQNRELAAANRLKSEFLANMSHELRTPLNSIIGFSEVLKEGLLGELPPNQLDYITEVYQSGRHLLSLINDILDLSKIEAGRMELDIESIDLEEMTINALKVMKEIAAKGGVTMKRQVDPLARTIDADGRKVKQIVYNLLSNAVKFTTRGGSVELSINAAGDEVEIAVKDTGIGIASADIERLFRPFEQLEGGMARRFEGTGLGLALVKNLVELHGGTLGVESLVGRGSRFWVRLPRTTSMPRVARTAPPPTQRLPVFDSPRVLVVDDDPAAISLAQRWLETEGFVVVGAQTCDDAWLEIQRHAPDAVLLDILFEIGPGGWELLERLRATHPEIPVVIVSIVADLERGLALGALEVLQKPVSGVDLLRAIESLGIPFVKAGDAPNVLVVDDDPHAVEHVAKRLEDANLMVTRAYGGREALDAVASTTFSAIVLDLMMPEISGFDIVKQLRSAPATAGLPIIVLTAKILEPSERAILERSVQTVLAKGEWNANKFLHVIRDAVRTSKPLLGGASE